MMLKDSQVRELLQLGQTSIVRSQDQPPSMLRLLADGSLAVASQNGTNEKPEFKNFIDLASFGIPIQDAKSTGDPGKRAFGVCPRCGRNVIERPRSYSCEANESGDCGLVIWRKVLGKKLPVQAVRELLVHGESGVVQGFKYSKGDRFDGRLKLTDQGEAKVIRIGDAK